MLEKLMQMIGELEVQHFHRQSSGGEDRTCSSFYPYPYPSNLSHASQEHNNDGTDAEFECCPGPLAQRFLPCHYFDNISGSSTGG